MRKKKEKKKRSVSIILFSSSLKETGYVIVREQVCWSLKIWVNFTQLPFWNRKPGSGGKNPGSTDRQQCLGLPTWSCCRDLHY